MSNRKSFSLVPLAFVLMLGALGFGSTLRHAQAAAPTIDLDLGTAGNNYFIFAPSPTTAPVPTEVVSGPNAATITDGGANVQSITAKLTLAGAETLSATSNAAAPNGVRVTYATSGGVGTLTLDIDPAATTPPSTAAFQQVLRTVVYAAPDGISGSRNINFTITTDDLINPTATATATVQEDNDPTTIDLNGTDAASAGVNYTSKIWVNGSTVDFGAVNITDTDATILDTDNFLKNITVKLGDGNPATLGDSPDSTDEKIFSTLSTQSSGNVKVTTINAHSLLLEPVTGNFALRSDFIDVLRTLQYDNLDIFGGGSATAGQPSAVTPGNRTVNFSADGGAQALSTATTTVPVEFANQGPQVDLNGSSDGTNNQITFSEQQSIPSPALLASGGKVTEPEDQFISLMRVTLDGRVDQNQKSDSDQTAAAIEGLSLYSNGSVGVSPDPNMPDALGNDSGTLTATVFDPHLNNNNGANGTQTFSYNYNASTGVLNITGNAYDIYWTAILQHIYYRNTSDDPTTTDRLATVQAFDKQDGTPNAPSTTIAVEKVNDSPAFPSLTSGPGSVAAGAGHQTSMTIVISDVDDETDARVTASTAGANSDLYIEMTLGVTHGILSLDNTEGSVSKLKFTYGSDNSANMAFVGREQDINDVLSGLTFTSDASYTDNALLTVQVDDQSNTGLFGTTPKVILVNIGPGATGGAPPVIDLNGPGPNPDGDVNYFPTFVKNQGAINITASTAFLYDADDNINKVVVSLYKDSTLAAAPGGAAENLNATPYDASKVIISYDSTTKVLTLTKTGLGTEADLENVLRTVTYNHASPAADDTGRYVTFQVFDSAGNVASAFSSIDFDSGGPTLNLDPDNSSGGADDGNFTKTYDPATGATKVADTDATITDLDQQDVAASFTINNLQEPGDELLLFDTTGTSITGSYNSATGVLTLNGIDTDANYQKVLRTVRYSNVNPNPTQLDRVITVMVRDNVVANASTKTSTLVYSVIPTNSNASIDLNGDGTGTGTDGTGVDFSTTWDQAGTTSLTDTDATVADPDLNIKRITVAINTTPDGFAEQLTATSGNGVTATYDGNTGILTLSGGASGASPNAFITAIRTVKYQNSATTPTGTSRSFLWEVYPDDANNLPNPEVKATTTISTTGGGTTSSIDLNGAGVGTNYSATWDQTATNDLAPSATVTETDNSVRRITVTFTPQDGANEILNATTSGGVSVSYDNNGKLTLDGSASPSAFQTVLQTVTYQDTAGVNSTGTTRTFTFNLYGNDTSTITSSATTTLSTTGGGGGGGTPSIDLDANDSSGATGSDFTGVWNQAAQTTIADTDATVGDTTNTIDKLTVTINNPPDGTDEVLDATATLPTGFTKSYDAAAGVLTITGPGTPSQFIPITRSVKYIDNAPTINGTSRTFTFSVFDGANQADATSTITVGGGGGGTASTTLDLDTSTTGTDFTGTWDGTTNSSNPITKTVKITDSDNLIKGATVTILDVGDAFKESLTATDTGNITHSFQDGVLTITGDGTATEYATVLASIRYSNSAAAPTYTTRHFQVDINGGVDVNGNALTATAYSTISQDTNTNNLPDDGATIDLNGPGAQSYNAGVNFSRNWNLNWQGDPTTLSQTKLADSDAIASKFDNTNINKVTVQFYDDPNDGITTGNQDGAAEVLSATNAGAVTQAYDAGTQILTLSGPGNSAEFTAAVRSVIYTNSKATPTGTQRKFIFMLYANDATKPTAFAITSIKVGGFDANDIDGDGISNDVDTDKDGDGILDTDDPDTDGNGVTDPGLADRDGDGIPDIVDPDNNNNGIPNAQDTNDRAFIDLNGKFLSGQNYQAAWNQKGATILAASDSFISEADGTVQTLTVHINNLQDGDVEVLSATAVTGVSVAYSADTATLTLTGPASPDAFQQVLRTVTYVNPGSDVTTTSGSGSSGTGTGSGTTTTTKQVIHGKNRTFTFLLTGLNGQTSTATTTISTSGNLGIFTVTPTFTANSGKLVYQLTNNSSSTWSDIVVNGAITGQGHANLDALSITPSQGTFTAKWSTPRTLERLMDPDKIGKNIKWYVGSLTPGQSATLTIVVPLNQGAEGSMLSDTFSAVIPGAGIATQSVGGVTIVAP